MRGARVRALKWRVRAFVWGEECVCGACVGGPSSGVFTRVKFCSFCKFWSFCIVSHYLIYISPSPSLPSPLPPPSLGPLGRQLQKVGQRRSASFRVALIRDGRLRHVTLPFVERPQDRQ